MAVRAAGSIAIVTVAAAGVVVTFQPASAGINSHGSGLYPSETLSTPPSQRHGGYWSDRKTETGRQHPRQASGRAQPK